MSDGGGVDFGDRPEGFSEAEAGRKKEKKRRRGDAANLSSLTADFSLGRVAEVIARASENGGAGNRLSLDETQRALKLSYARIEKLEDRNDELMGRCADLMGKLAHAAGQNIVLHQLDNDRAERVERTRGAFNVLGQLVLAAGPVVAPRLLAAVNKWMPPDGQEPIDAKTPRAATARLLMRMQNPPPELAEAAQQTLQGIVLLAGDDLPLVQALLAELVSAVEEPSKVYPGEAAPQPRAA